jgi:hypothetical protein
VTLFWKTIFTQLSSSHPIYLLLSNIEFPGCNLTMFFGH